MDFGKEQLMKYGWTEGKGLGKNEDGITVPLKITLKFDTAGIGSNKTDVWNEMYNKAVKNLNIKLHGDEISSSATKDIRNTVTSNELEQARLDFNKFLTASTPTVNQLMRNKLSAKANNEKSAKINSSNGNFFKISDASHKAAMILKLSGKLDRIAKQDKIFANTNKFWPNTNLSRKGKDVAHRNTSVKSDTEEEEHLAHSDTNLSQSEQHTDMTRYMSKRRRKKINNLARRLESCSIKEIDEKPKDVCVCDSLGCQKLCRKAKRKRKEKANLKLLRDQVDNGRRQDISLVHGSSHIPTIKERKIIREKKIIQNFNKKEQHFDQSTSNKKRKNKRARSKKPITGTEIEEADFYYSKLKRRRRRYEFKDTDSEIID